MFDPIVSSLPDPFVQQQAGQDADVSKLPDPFKSVKPAKESKSDVLRRLGKEEGVTDVTPLLAIGNQELGESMRPTVSGAGAIGGMQVLPATGLRYVSPQEWATDEGKMRAGVRYYKDLLKQFNGNEQQAIAGYFTGQGNVNKAVKSGANLPNTLDPISNLRTPQYVNQVQQKIDKNIPADVKALPDPFATSEDIASLPDPFAKPSALTPAQLAADEPWRQPAPVVNVGAPGRSVQQQLPDNFDTRKYLPREKSKPTAAPVGARTQQALDMFRDMGEGQEVSTVTNKPTQSLTQRAGGPQVIAASKARFAQQQAARQQAFQNALNAPADQRDAAIRELAKLGPLEEGEQQQLGITPHYLQSLMNPLFARSEEIGAGVARLGGKIGIPGAQSGYEYLKQKAEEDRLRANRLGVRGNVGDILGTLGELVPDIALSRGVPAGGIAAEAYWPTVAMAGAAGRGGGAEEIVKAGLGNVTPIVGAKLFAGAPLLGRIAANVALNETTAGMSGGAKDVHSILTAGILATAMGWHGKPGSVEEIQAQTTPEDIARAERVGNDTNVVRAAQEFATTKSPESEAALQRAMVNAGMPVDQAAAVIRDTKSASSVTQENLPVTQESTTTPESLTQGENQNAVITGSEQRGQEYRGTARGADLRENGGQVRQAESSGPERGNRPEESGQVQVPAENEPQVLGQTASVKAFITRADEAELRNRGYTDDQIYKMKPDEAQRILSRPATVTHSNPEIDGKPVIAQTASGKVVVENPNNVSGVSIVKDQTPEPVTEFEAPPKTADMSLVENKSILEAVRALGRIQIDQDSVERGEFSQFGNKEAKGQNLVGPNGKLKPDEMREQLEDAGFHDPGSDTLSLDGMWELMDREQRGDKVYSTHRDANEIDRDLAAEYEKHAESAARSKQFEHEQFIESEWADPQSPLRQSYEGLIAGEPDAESIFRYTADKYGISPETIDEHIQRATRIREGGAPAANVPGVSDGGGEATTGEGRVTGIKNAVKEAERAERGLSPVEVAFRSADPALFDKVKADVDSGKIDIRALTEEWRNTPPGQIRISREDMAALAYDAGRISNARVAIIDQIMEAIASGDKAAEMEARARLAPLEDLANANDEASRRTGTEWSDIGRFRQLLVKQDFSLAALEREYRAKAGDKVNEKTLAQIKDLSEQLEKAQRDVVKRDEIISAQEAKIWTRNAARKEAASARGIKRAGSLDKIKKEWDNQKDQLVRLLKLQGIGEPPEGGGPKLPYSSERGAIDPNLVTLPADVSKLLIEMARNRIRAGFTDAVDIIDRIHESIKDQFEVTKRQISDAISGYGKQAKLSNDPVEVQLREVKRVRRLMSALEDAQKGEAPLRSGLTREKPSRVVRELTRQVNEALRKQGIEIERAGRSPEEQYQSALDGVKTRLRNQIEDLDKQIETGIKPDKTKTPIPLDEEAKALTAERDAKKAILAELEGPQERQARSEEQVSNARKNALRKQIDALDRQHGGAIAPEKASRTENYDDETHALMAERDMLRRSLQDPTTKNKEAVRTRLVEAERKLREGDLSRKEADYPSSIYDDAETKGLKNQLKATNKRIADARALPEKIAKLEAQKAEVVRRLRERDFSKPETPDVQPKNVAPEIAKRQAELKDLNKELAAAKAEQNQVDAIQKRNTELRRRIREKDFEAAPKAPAKPVSPRIEVARQERAKLQAEYDSIKPAKQMTPEQRNAATERALEKSIADNESRIAEKRLMPDGKPEPANSPRIEALRARNTEVKKALEDLRANDPAVQAKRDADALKTYKKKLDTQEADLIKKRDEMKAGTYVEPSKKSITLDAAARAKQVQVGRIKDEIRGIMRRTDLENRSNTAKVLDYAVKWFRGVKLMHIPTIGKLLGFGASRQVATIAEDIEGGVMAQLPYLKQVAALAPREGSFNVKATAKGITTYFKEMGKIVSARKDIRELQKTGKSAEDILFGRLSDMPPEAIDAFQNFHKVLKHPVFAAEFEKSLEYRTAWGLKNIKGFDPTDPVTQMELGTAAYGDGMRAILMGDNFLVQGFNGALRMMENSKIAPNAGKATAALLRSFMPIVKVPTNYVLENSSYVPGVGLLKGAARLGFGDGLKLRTFATAIKELTPDQADYVMRAFKKQGVGMALTLIGYFAYKSLGGYFTPKNERDENAPHPGNVRIGGKEIGHTYLHFPAIEMLQMGATIHRVEEKYHGAGKVGGFGEGVFRASKGALGQTPFLEEPQRMVRAVENRESLYKFGGETAAGDLIPGLVGDTAAFFDKDAQGNPIVRKPQGFTEPIRMAIPSPLPFNRKTVPTEADRAEEKKAKALEQRQNPDVNKIIERKQRRAK